MSTQMTRTNGNEVTLLEQVVLGGDLKALKPEERIRYYREVCNSLGLNPLTQPFQYITLNGKLTLYARKDCADQLRSTRGVSITGLTKENVGDLYVVTARAQLPNGRTDEEIGAVNVKGLFGENLANAMMKACTKAKRRVTLSICGLGMLDETEVETIRDARPVRVDQTTGEIVEEPRTQVQQIARASDPPVDAGKHEREDGVTVHAPTVDPATGRPAAAVYRNEDAPRDDFAPRTTAEDAALGKHIASLKGWMTSRKLDPENRDLALYLLNMAAGAHGQMPGWRSRKELTGDDWKTCTKYLMGTKPADLAQWVQGFYDQPKPAPDADLEPCICCGSTDPVGSCACTMEQIADARANAEAERLTGMLIDVDDPAQVSGAFA